MSKMQQLAARVMQAAGVQAEGLEDACWEGYEAYGMKDKGGRKVPNCVPKQSSPVGRRARFEKGVSADPTENMSEEDAATWREMNEKYKDVVKDKHSAARARASARARQSAKKAETFECPKCGSDVLAQTSYCVKCQKKVKQACHHMPMHHMEAPHLPEGQGDEGAQMFRAALFHIAKNSAELHKVLGDHAQIPQWCHYKVAEAEAAIDTVRDFLTYQVHHASGHKHAGKIAATERYVPVKDLPPILRKALRDGAGYNKRDIRLRVSPTYYSMDAGDGSRPFAMAVNLETNRFEVYEGGWGQGMDERGVTPPNGVVVTGLKGYETYAVIFANPSIMTRLLEEGDPVVLTEQEEYLLHIIRAFRSSARQIEMEMAGIRGTFGPSHPLVQSLEEKGLIRTTGAGISVTTAGKNFRLPSRAEFYRYTVKP